MLSQKPTDHTQKLDKQMEAEGFGWSNSEQTC